MALTGIRAMFVGSAIAVLTAGCSGRKISETCDEPQAYQSVVPSKKIEVPEGLDPLDDFREMPVPEATGPKRLPGDPCIERAPSILTKKSE